MTTENISTAAVLPSVGAGLRVPRQYVAALLVIVGLAALAVPMTRQDGAVGALWALGLAAGLTLQRSRFCFASAFRDIFLFGSARMMKAILLGLAIATIGFAAIMHAAVPFPAFGALPPAAHILPVGLSTALGGLLFGYGMVLAGGCVSGSLYRAAEGYVGSWVALAGIVLGLAVVSWTWNWWYLALIQREPKLFLPALGGLEYAGAVALTFAALLVVFVVLVWWESRTGLVTPPPTGGASAPSSFSDQLSALWRAVFVRGWPAPVGAVSLALLGVVMYTVSTPLGVTGELQRWANAGLSIIGAAPPAPLGLGDVGGCAALSGEQGLFSHSFALTVGVFGGALVGALLAKEFKLRVPRRAVRLAQSLVGGGFMGLGAGLAAGCTIGAFFSAIPSLSLSGWLFGAALAAGAYGGVLTIRRIP